MKNHEDRGVTSEIEEVIYNDRLSNQIINDWVLLEECQSHIHPSKRVRQCNTKLLPNNDSVAIYTKRTQGQKKTSISSGFYGTQKCGNKTCVVCSNNVSNKQTAKVEELVNRALHGGLDTYFVTLTMARSNNLDWLWEINKSSFTEFRRKLKRRLKKIGYDYHYVANKDFTFTKDRRKGVYNIHLHLLLFIKPSVSQNKALEFTLLGKDTRKGLKRIVKDLWTDIVKSKGHRSVEQAQDFQQVQADTKKEELASYVVKISKTNSRIAYEVTRNSSKTAKHNNSFGLFELLTRIYHDKEDKSLQRIYKEFTSYTSQRGKHFFTSGKGIDKWFDKNIVRKEEELTEDKITEETIEEVRLEMSKCCFDLITSLKLRGLVMRSLIGTWDNSFSLSRLYLEMLCKASMKHKDYMFKIEQINELRDYIVLFIGSLEIDELLDSKRSKQLINKLSKSSS